MKLKDNHDLDSAVTNAFFYWDSPRLTPLLMECNNLVDLYNSFDKDNWVKEGVGEDNELNVKIIRAVYLLSKIAENHGSTLAAFRMKFPKLWERIEKQSKVG